jgi:hypothetical protein
MLRRLAHILFVGFQVVWLNAFLPGHQRGIVTVPGYSPDASCHGLTTSSLVENGCCSARPSDFDDAERKSDRQQNRAKHCAVCFFAARLSTPPAIISEIQAPQFVELTPIPVLESIDPVVVFSAYFSRGPPLV